MNSDDGSGWEKARENTLLFKNYHTAKFLKDRKFPPHWNKPDVRGALYAMHGKACAFCQSLLPRNDRGDVEHFRPKKEVTKATGHLGYWWLAYSFSNYLLSCRTCNQTRKRNHFMLRTESTRVSFKDRHNLDRETRLLLEPSRDEVEAMIDINLDSPLLRLDPKPQLSTTDRAKVLATSELFSWNTDIELVKNRKRAIRAAEAAIKYQEWDRLANLASRYEADAWTIRQFLKARNLDQHIPKPEKELDTLLAQIKEDVDLILLAIESSENKQLREQLAEKLWTLAVLWFDPPARSREEVAQFLENEKLKTFVKPKFDQIQAPEN